MADWIDPGLGDFEGMNPDRVRHLLHSAAQMAHTHMNHYPAWLFAGEVFRVGPKIGMNLCVHAGLDPSKLLRALRADIAPKSAKG